MERKITIEEKERYQEDYQMRMLKVNRPEGLLRVRGRGVDGRSFYEYDVSGKVSMKALYERGKIRENDLKQFLASFQTAVRETENYLLNVHRILLKPEYIFYEDDRFYFCYYPPADQDLWTEFHLLTEYLVKQADYQDKEAVRMIFLLHKGTMGLDHRAGDGQFHSAGDRQYVDSGQTLLKQAQKAAVGRLGRASY